MAIQNERILASDVNSIFSRLQQLRVKHLSGAGQSSSAITSLTPEFDETPTEQGKKIQEQYTLMKQYINILRKSVFLTSITDNDVNSIVVPEVGSLLKLVEYGTTDTLITRMEGMAFTNGTNFASFFTTHRTNFGGNFTTDRTNFGGNFTTDRTNFGGNFTSNHSGNFTTNRSNHSSNFTTNRSNHSTNFTTNRTNFIGNFGLSFTFGGDYTSRQTSSF